MLGHRSSWCVLIRFKAYFLHFPLWRDLRGSPGKGCPFMVDSFGYPYAYIVNFLWVSLWRLSLRGLVLGFWVSLWITLARVCHLFRVSPEFCIVGWFFERWWLIYSLLFVCLLIRSKSAPAPHPWHGSSTWKLRLDQNHVNSCFFVYSLLCNWDSSLRGDSRTATWRVCIGRRLKNVREKEANI